MSEAELCYADIADLSHRLRNRELSPIELTRAFLDRISSLDSSLHAYATVLTKEALDDARRAEAELNRGVWRGPMHGVPVAVKDLCFTKGIRTTCGMWIYRDFRPGYDATAVTRLRNAGAVLLGKLQLTEGGWIRNHPQFPTPLNPWDADRWTGASSNGPATATAAGICTASIGSDSGGSIRFPCAMNGLTGIKPTWGRVSLHGVFAFAPSMDHLGPIARSAEDAGHVLQVIAGGDPNDPMSLCAPVPDFVCSEPSVRGLRIGLDPNAALKAVEAEVASVVEGVARTLESLGADICRVQMPPSEILSAGFGSYSSAEAAVVHEATFPARAAEYGPFLQSFLEQGQMVSGMEMARLERERLTYSGALEKLFEDIDILLIPVLPTTGRELTPNLDVPKELIGSFTSFTTPFNFSGNPTITMPGGSAADGISIAIQLVAPRLGERRLITAGRAFQSATDWHLARPSFQE
ncbi:MAG: amidase [Hyphomicrobiaceae bacterium]